MRFLIYDKTNGVVVRDVEASIIEDACYGLPEGYDAIASNVLYTDAYVLNGEVLLKEELPHSVTATDITLGNSVFWKKLPEGTGVFVDQTYIGKVEADGIFELHPEEKGTYQVSLIKPFKYKKKEYTVNVS